MKKIEVINPSETLIENFGLSGLIIENVKIIPSSLREMIVNIRILNSKSYVEFEKLDAIIKEYLSEYEGSYKLSYNLKFDKNTNILDAVNYILKQIYLENKAYSSILYDYEVFLDNEDIIINLATDIQVQQAMEQNLHIELLKKLNAIYGEIKGEVDIVKNNYRNIKKVKEEKSKAEYTPLIIDLEIGKIIESVGEVFDITYKEIKTKNNQIKKIYSFFITDYKKSILCKKFYNEKDDVAINIGDMVEVKGTYRKDEQYTKEYYLDLKAIKKLSEVNHKIIDDAPVKRVELNIKTNMSEMYSNIESKKLTSIMNEIGYSAYAVADLGVVHSYPFLYNKKLDTKVIFGIDAYMVDDNAKLVINPKDVILEEETYVVFDIETTGFDPYNDKIIEIGAIKIRKSEIIDRFSMFINPQMPIPEKIKELTNIKDEDVEKAETIDRVLPLFLEFVNNTTLVAHNANFDVGFIVEKSNQLGIKTDLSYIDTIQWAKLTMPDQKRFSLDALCKTFNLVNDSHHRAISDAKVTAEVFKILLQKVSLRNVNTLKDVNENLQLDIKIAPVLRTTILVKNKMGLKTLYELVSKSFIENFGKSKPRIPKSLLEKNRENLLISSAPVYNFDDSGELISLYIRGIDKAEIEEIANFYDYIQILPSDCYVKEIENGEVSSKEYIEEMNKYFYQLGKKLNKKVVAVGNVMYMTKKESKAKTVLQIANSEIKSAKYDTNAYFRTTNEMLSNFEYLGKEIAYEVVVKNTNDIANEIDKIRPIPEGFYPPKIEGADELVKKMTYDKAEELYGKNMPELIKNRIEKELNAIIGNGYGVLYLIAQKLVNKSVENGYLVGSRGSVGSSIVAYLIGITEVNGLEPHYRCPNLNCKNVEIFDKMISGVDLPAKNCPKCNIEYIRDGHAIPFEVFMGFNGDKIPDIDLNFSGEFQSSIHKYTAELFGEKNVFRAGTITTTAENNAIGYVKKYFEEINKQYLREESIKHFGDYHTNPEQESFRETIMKNIFSKNMAEIKRLSKMIIGCRKTTGQHAGGMVVLPSDMSIYDFTPIQKPANNLKSESTTTHFDYHVMDEQLVKLDILGHDDPTTLKILEEITGISPHTLPLNDEKVISIFSSTEALGVKGEDIGTDLGINGIPEFGTNFVKEMLKDIKPKSFSELVRVSGLSHGTNVWLNNAKDYIAEKTATFDEIITARDDIMNYLILQGMEKITAFKIMEFIRKGNATKPHNKSTWEEYKKLMEETGVKKWYIESCSKIEYLFPKGHAVAYVMMAIRIAYFKVYYPLEFYTAYLNRKIESFSVSKMYQNIEKLKNRLAELNALSSKTVNDKKEITLLEILIEMYYRGIELLPVDLYESEAKKFIIHNGKIRIPFIGVDQLGEVVANNIVNEREKGNFTSIENFINRTSINSSVIKTLREYRVLDRLNETDQQTLF